MEDLSEFMKDTPEKEYGHEITQEEAEAVRLWLGIPNFTQFPADYWLCDNCQTPLTYDPNRQIHYSKTLCQPCDEAKSKKNHLRMLAGHKYLQTGTPEDADEYLKLLDSI